MALVQAIAWVEYREGFGNPYFDCSNGYMVLSYCIVSAKRNGSAYGIKKTVEPIG